MKFGTCDISNIQISILMSKFIFIKYLPRVRPKLVPKLKVHRIYWNLEHSIFQICAISILISKMFFYKIFTNCYSLIGPKMINTQNLLRFGQVDISNMLTSILMSKWFILNIYYLLGPNWSKIKSVQNLLKFNTFNISITLISI